METENAAASARLTRKYRTRYLWQVPVFVLGLCAVAGAWAGRPLWHDADARTFSRALNALREEMERPSPDAARARALGEEALPFLERFRRHAGDVHYLLGSSYLMLAGSAEPADAPELWRRARNHLEQADALGVAPDQVNRLRFRLGKAWFYTDVEPHRVLDCLLTSVDSAEDRVEGFGMIAQSYLRLPTPDVRAALQANQKQLSQPIDDDRLLAPARLLRGELFLRVKEPSLARDALTRIPNSAPPEILARARYLRAGIAQEEGLWAEAVQSWEQVLGEGTVPAEGLARVRYNMGVRYQRLSRPGEAARAWELVLDAGGIEAPAAALALANLRDAAGDTAAALKMYECFFRDSAPATEYRNELAPLPETRGQIVRSFTRWREKKDYARAQQLARLYVKLSRPGEADDLRARAADDWAAELSRAGAGTKAVEQYREAASGYLALANATLMRDQQARGFRSAAERYTSAKDYAAALAMLDQYRTRETVPESIGESWFHTAQVYQALGNRENAAGAYRKCIEFPGSAAFRARLALAQIDNEDGRLDVAEEILKQNLELDLSYESEARRLTLFTLADLLHKRGKYTLASQGYQEALDHYPTDARAAEARFHLGDCYRLLADLENQNLGLNRAQSPDYRLIEERRRRWEMMALANFQKLADDLSARRASVSLTPEEEVLVRAAEFAVGGCQINLGHYTEALKLFEMLTVRYRYQVEHLNALREMWRCHWIMRNPEKARETARRMRPVLREMDPKKIEEGTGQSLETWQGWVEFAEKP